MNEPISTKNYRLLIVDDDPSFHQQIRYAFRRQYTFEGARDEHSLWEKLESDTPFDLLLLDLVLNVESGEKKGLELLPKIKEKRPDLPILVSTSERDISTVVQAMKIGADDFLAKGDFEFDFWRAKIDEHVKRRRLQHENTELRNELKRTRAGSNLDPYPFIGESGEVAEIKRILALIAEEPDVTLLLTGETGTGKEVAARYLHRNGPRKDRPFQAVNLSAIQDTLLESTLFGHRKGAFTGATRDMEGYFGQADGGILLLDEIGDIDAGIQVKLLRFLETKLIRPVGSDRDVQLDVQVIAATHQNLEAAVREGRFRADLYQRLKAMVVELPPLRRRREDIPLLLEHFFQTDSLEELLTPGALEELLAYRWEGNIRELRNAVSYMELRRKILNRFRIDRECLPRELVQPISSTRPEATIYARPPGSPPAGTSSAPAPPVSDLSAQHALIDLERIERALLDARRIKSEAAQALGIENTDNLRYRVKKHFEKHPEMFDRFPTIQRAYHRICGN